MPKGHARSVCAIALVVLVAAAPRVAADLQVPLPRLQPLILHLEGTMAADRAAAAAEGFTTLSFAVVGRDPDQRYWLGVSEVRALADYPRLGKDILDDLYMYDPMLFVVGSPRLVEQFVNLRPATRVTLEGLTQGASRTFYLRSVTVAEP